MSALKNLGHYENPFSIQFSNISNRVTDVLAFIINGSFLVKTVKEFYFSLTGDFNPHIGISSLNPNVEKNAKYCAVFLGLASVHWIGPWYGTALTLYLMFMAEIVFELEKSANIRKFQILLRDLSSDEINSLAQAAIGFKETEVFKTILEGAVNGGDRREDLEVFIYAYEESTKIIELFSKYKNRENVTRPRDEDVLMAFLFFFSDPKESSKRNLVNKHETKYYCLSSQLNRLCVTN